MKPSARIVDVPGLARRSSGKARSVSDLRDCYRAINAKYFRNRLPRSMRVAWMDPEMLKDDLPEFFLGRCWGDLTQIVVHPVYALPQVPTQVVGSTVFHEMIHAIAFVTGAPDDHLDHGPKFKRVESQWPLIDACRAWKSKNYQAMLEWSRHCADARNWRKAA